MNDIWPKAKLADLLTQIHESVSIDNDTIYSQVTVRMHNHGLALRQKCRGEEIKTKKQYRIHTGQFICSRIDARNGAMGLVPPELNGAIVSNDFPVFEINSSKIDPNFFIRYTATDVFLSECLAKSRGTSNRRRLKEEEFLKIEIDLPNLIEQKRIIHIVEKVTEMRKYQLQILEEIDGLLLSSFSTNLWGQRI